MSSRNCALSDLGWSVAVRIPTSYSSQLTFCPVLPMYFVLYVLIAAALCTSQHCPLSLPHDYGLDEPVEHETAVFNESLGKLNTVGAFAIGVDAVVCNKGCPAAWPQKELLGQQWAHGRVLAVFQPTGGGDPFVVPSSGAFVSPRIVLTCKHGLEHPRGRLREVWFDTSSYVYPGIGDISIRRANMLKLNRICEHPLLQRIVEYNDIFASHPFTDQRWVVPFDFAFLEVVNATDSDVFLFPSSLQFGDEIFCVGYAMASNHFKQEYRRLNELYLMKYERPFTEEDLRNLNFGYHRKVISSGAVQSPPDKDYRRLLCHSACTAKSASGSLCFNQAVPRSFGGISIGKDIQSEFNTMWPVDEQGFVFEYTRIVAAAFAQKCPCPPEVVKYITLHRHFLEKHADALGFSLSTCTSCAT